MKGILNGVVGALLVLACAGAGAQDLGRARQLIDAKQFKQAYELLEPHEQTRAGDPEFDYLLGIAAIDAGQLTRGVFALERVLAVEPNHARARAEIARAYFLMGENRTARAEFQAVKAAQPPAEVSATVDRFLDALDARERARHTGATGYFEVGLGHDSNVNAATSSSSFGIPAFGGAIFTLAPGAAQDSDWFWTVAGGFNGRYGLNDRVGLIGSASAERKSNFQREQFDTGSWNASGGVSVREGGNEFIFALQGQRYDVENNRFRDAVGGVAQYRHNLSPSDQVSVYAQYTRLEYPGQSVRNADRYVVGAALAHAYTRPGNPVVYAGAYAGEEDAMAEGFPHFGHELWGLRAGGQIGLTDKWTFTAGVNYEERRYGGQDPLFLTKRHDKEMQLRAAFVYSIDRFWSVTPAFTWTNAQSNVLVNDYDRRLVSVTLRRDFR